MFSAGVAVRDSPEQAYVCDLSVVIGPYRYAYEWLEPTAPCRGRGRNYGGMSGMSLLCPGLTGTNRNMNLGNRPYRNSTVPLPYLGV